MSDFHSPKFCPSTNKAPESPPQASGTVSLAKEGSTSTPATLSMRRKIQRKRPNPQISRIINNLPLTERYDILGAEPPKIIRRLALHGGKRLVLAVNLFPPHNAPPSFLPCWICAVPIASVEGLRRHIKREHIPILERTLPLYNKCPCAQPYCRSSQTNLARLAETVHNLNMNHCVNLPWLAQLEGPGVQEEPLDLSFKN